MQGHVIFVSRNRGMGVVQWSDGFTYMEFLDGEPEVGDLVEGDWDAVASEMILNKTQSCRMEVFLERTYGSKKTAIAEASRRGGGSS